MVEDNQIKAQISPFAIREGGRTVGAGIVVKILE